MEKSLEKVCAIELKSLVKSFCFGYTMIIISISDGGNLMLKRKIEQRLIDWKNDPEHKPLIIKGCRQCGKTYSALDFAKKNYAHVVYLNFFENPDYASVFSGSLEPDNIVMMLSALLGKNAIFETGKTVLILDEIQDCPEARTALKFFRIDGRYDVIATGSLLGVKGYGKEPKSVPVGSETVIDMYPLDFEEFLWAKGYDDTTIQNMLAHMKELRPFNELEMKVYHSLFLDFCVLGGMPAVVTEYIQRNTFENSLDTQRQLISDYKEDIRKYAQGIDQTRILNVFNRIAPQLARENKKFQISKVASGARFRDYRGCAEWLVDAGMVNICYCLEFPELPLGGNYDPDVFKLYFADTGLLVSMLDDESQEDLRANKNLGVYKGALYENIVGEALVKQHYKLYYYKRDTSTLETDFFIRSMTSLIPVEVKAATGKAKSMNTLISSDRYPDIRYGFKFSAQNIGHENFTYTFPYFCIFLLKRFMADFHPAEERISE